MSREQPGRSAGRDDGAPALRLLLVEDSDTDAELFQALIRTAKFLPQPQVQRARSIAEATRQLHGETPDCILLDLGLPDAAGLSGLTSLRAADATPAILMLTGYDDEQTALAALRSGAQEYIVKDDADGKTLGRAILRSIQRHRLIADLSTQQRDAEFEATHDLLTGLGNRRLLERHLQSLTGTGAAEQPTWSVVTLDLDGFKAINDMRGHGAGDEVLREIARRLRLSARREDLVVRLGGDEFLMVLAATPSASNEQFARRLRSAIEQPIRIGEDACSVSASIGIASHPDDGTDPAHLVERADQRMYADKAARQRR